MDVVETVDCNDVEAAHVVELFCLRLFECVLEVGRLESVRPRHVVLLVRSIVFASAQVYVCVASVQTIELYIDSL